MCDSLAVKLKSFYPRLYKSIESVECQGGWEDIIMVMSRLIQAHIDHTRNQAARDIWYNRCLIKAMTDDSIQPLLRGYYKNDSPTAIKLAEQDLCDRRFKEIIYSCQQVNIKSISNTHGRLKVQYSGGDHHVLGIIRMSECISMHVCEVCGNKGQILPEIEKIRCETHKDD